MSDYSGDATLESWLVHEILDSGETPSEELIAELEPYRKAIEDNIDSWFDTDDGEGNCTSWRDWGRGWSSLSDEDQAAVEKIMTSHKASTLVEGYKPSLDALQEGIDKGLQQVSPITNVPDSELTDPLEKTLSGITIMNAETPEDIVGLMEGMTQLETQEEWMHTPDPLNRDGLQYRFKHLGPEPEHNQMCVFKCYDYTTEIVGRYDRERKHFYVQRGDGLISSYGFGIEWFKLLEIVPTVKDVGIRDDDNTHIENLRIRREIAIIAKAENRVNQAITKLGTININIWDDFYEDGYVPEGKNQETYAYVDHTDSEIDDLACNAILTTLKEKIETAKLLPDDVIMVVQFYDSSIAFPVSTESGGGDHHYKRWQLGFTNITHASLAKLLVNIKDYANLRKFDIYSES